MKLLLIVGKKSMIHYNGQVLPLCPWPAVHFSSPILFKSKKLMCVEWNGRALAENTQSYQTHAPLMGMVYLKCWNMCAAGLAASLSPHCPCRSRLVVCCCGWCSSQGRSYTVSWLVRMKVIATSDFWLSSMLPTCFPQLPTPARLHYDG